MALIENHLPAYHFRSHHQILINASPKTVYSTIWEINIGESKLIRLLFFLRGLPKPFLSLKSITKRGFIRLQESDPKELILGLVAKPWKPQGEMLQITAKDFADFAEKGWVKVAWNFRLEELPEQLVELNTETRILCTDGFSKRLFSLYWFFIAPFSGLVRTEMLRLIKERAEGVSK